MSRWPIPAAWIVLVASAALPAPPAAKQSFPAAALPPPGAGEGLLGACRLSGSVVVEPDGREYLKLDVKLEFRTDADNILVPIGFKGARLIHAALDKETPLWGPEADGFTVLVPKARDYHQLELTMLTPVHRSGAERRVTIDRLPKSAITTLDWHVPNRRTTVRLPAHPFADQWAELTISEAVVRNSAVVKGVGNLQVTAVEGGSRLQSEALGVIDHLEAAWSMGFPGTELQDAAAVIGEMTVVVNERDRTLDTSAWLRIECRTGSVQKLVFRLAADASVSHVESEPKGTPLDWKFAGDKRLLTIHLRQPLRPNQPSTTLRIYFDQKINVRPNAGLNVGLLSLVEPGALLETGTITVLSRQRVSFVRQQVRPIAPRERPSADPRLTAYAFAYSSQPADLQLLLDPPAGPASPPVAEVRPRLQLSFPPSGDIVLEALFDVARMQHGELEQLDICWPAEWSVEAVENAPGVNVGAAVDGVVRVRFDPPVSGTAEVRLAGRCRAASNLLLHLPYPHAAAGVQGKLHLQTASGELQLLPGESKVWIGAASSGISVENHRNDLSGPLASPTTFLLSPPRRQVPWRLALSVQPRRHEVRSQSRVFVTESEFQVQQTLVFRFVKSAAAAAPGNIIVRIPEEVEASLEARLALLKGDRYLEGSIALFDRPGGRGNGWVEKEIALPREPEAQIGCEVIFSYRRRHEAAQTPQPLAVPLVVPGEGYALIDSAEARIWASAGMHVEPERDRGWQPATKGESSSRRQPRLNLRSLDAGNPLHLRVAAITEALEPELTAERALIEATHNAAGEVCYRARFSLTKISASRLRIHLPGPATRLDGLSLDQQEITRPQMDWTETAEGVLVTIDLAPQMLAEDALLEVRFRITPPRIARWGFVCHYPAPRLEGRVSVGTVRWRIESAADQLPLWASSAWAAGQGYSWQGLPWPGLAWLGFIAAPRAAAYPAAWEEWIGGSEPRPDAPHGYGLVQAGTVAPVSIVLAPRFAWLFLCSLGLVGGGILWHGRKPPRPLWGLAAVLLAAAILVLIAPSLALAVLYGVQPGVLVLAGFLLAMWVWRIRWRRRITSLPGFQRLHVDGPTVRSAKERPAGSAAAGV